MDASLIIALSALLVSILTPLFTLILKNSHELKMHNISFYEKHHSEAIEVYVQEASAALNWKSAESMVRYRQAFGEIFFHVDPVIWGKIRKLDGIIQQNAAKQLTSSSLGDEIFAEIIKYLSENNKPREHKTDKRHSKDDKK